jgi:hypothetical protein
MLLLALSPSMIWQPTYGPYKPHPLSQMRTELVWEGKYDEYGQHREVDIAGCAMPMQHRLVWGDYIACVKVVDTFGCDTSITVEVEV